MEQSAGPENDIVGRIYRGRDSKSARSALVVTRDPGGDYVWVENVDPPHTPRRVLRARLLSYRYDFEGVSDRPVGEDGRQWPPPPAFDGPRFAVWLRRAMEVEGLTVAQLEARSGVHKSMINTLRRGTPTKRAAEMGQKTLQPSINAIAAIAHGLGYEFAYVAAKAGIDTKADRWSNFSLRERETLAQLLDCELDELDDLLRDFSSPTKKETV